MIKHSKYEEKMQRVEEEEGEVEGDGRVGEEERGVVQEVQMVGTKRTRSLMKKEPPMKMPRLPAPEIKKVNYTY